MSRLVVLVLVVLWGALTVVGAEGHPPIPLTLTLKEGGYVTLVIEDAEGRRVRNLVSETWFPAGQSTIWWDGQDESNMIPRQIPGVASYWDISGNPVKPGTYRVRGLYRKAVDLHYEFAVYSGEAHPPWHTPDARGAWLADHTPPSATLFLPGTEPRVCISSFVAEAGEGLVWVDLDGHRVTGVRSIGGGGGWWGADYLARDAGEKPVPGITAYSGGAWEHYLEVWAMGGNRKILTHTFPDQAKTGMGGLAVQNGLIAVSLPAMHQVLFADAAGGKEYGTAPLASPRGLAFDAQGRLLALSGKQLLRLTLPAPAEGMAPTATATLVSGLEDPHGLALDGQGNIYISDWGNSHQVKVFSPEGKFLRAIGKPGAPSLGHYDPQHMDSPKGLTITPDGHLWVAEHSYVPKRVSVWALDGGFVKAFYGPNQYGGGGCLDPKDKTRFYVHGNGGGMEFKLDWQTGASELVDIYYRPGATGVTLPDFPQFPLYAHGRQYLTNCYTSGPTNGENVAALWLLRDGVAVPVAAVGSANHWTALRDPALKATWPAGVDLNGDPAANAATFVWSDLNDDGQVQPEEVHMVRSAVGSANIGGDLSVVLSSLLKLSPVGFTPAGAPIYDLSKGTVLAPGGRAAGTSGGGQVVDGRNGWTVMTWPPEPLPNGSLLAGAQHGKLRWTYPCPLLGLHNSALSQPPKSPGEMIGATRLLGLTLNPRGTYEELWAINGNMGVVYLLTTDGLFVATLFKDCRTTSAWPNEVKRDQLVNDFSLGQECFYPSITQASDGNIYLAAGQPTTCLFRIDGLETIQRLPDSMLTVSK